jgi:hypothetical protein
MSWIDHQHPTISQARDITTGVIAGVIVRRFVILFFSMVVVFIFRLCTFTLSDRKSFK